MAESWIKEWCVECKTINWICLGTIDNDLSRVDLDAYKCRKCGAIDFFGDKELFEFEKECGGWDSLEDCNWELGKERPD